MDKDRMKPILFSTPMVRAILEDRKTMTRRVIKPKYINTHLEIRTDKYGTRLIEIQNEDETTRVKNPDGTTTCKLLAAREISARYHPGDILWVRETWGLLWGFTKVEWRKMYPNSKMIDTDDNVYCYAADYSQKALEYQEKKGSRWFPSIHMPRVAARIFLHVTDVRAERVQDITVEDVIAEGLSADNEIRNLDPSTHESIRNWNLAYAQHLFRELWDSLNAKRGYGWDTNPWVWVYTLERIKGTHPV